MKQLSKDKILIKEAQTIHVFDQYATLIYFDTANCIVNILSEDLFTYSESPKSEIEIVKADDGQSIFFKNEEVIKKIIEHSVPDHRLNILKVYATSKKNVLLCVVSLERTKYKINNVSSKTKSPVYLYKILLDNDLNAVYMKPCFSLTDYFGVVYDKNLIHTDILRYLYYNSDSDILYCVNSTRISVIGGITNNNPVKLYDNIMTGGGVRSIENVTNKYILTTEISSFNKRGLWRVDTIMIDLVGILYLKQLSSITYDIISKNAYTDSTGNIKFLNKKYKVFEEFKKYNKIRFCFLLRDVQYDENLIICNYYGKNKCFEEKVCIIDNSHNGCTVVSTKKIQSYIDTVINSDSNILNYEIFSIDNLTKKWNLGLLSVDLKPKYSFNRASDFLLLSVYRNIFIVINKESTKPIKVINDCNFFGFVEENHSNIAFIYQALEKSKFIILNCCDCKGNELYKIDFTETVMEVMNEVKYTNHASTSLRFHFSQTEYKVLDNDIIAIALIFDLVRKDLSKSEEDEVISGYSKTVAFYDLRNNKLIHTHDASSRALYIF